MGPPCAINVKTSDSYGDGINAFVKMVWTYNDGDNTDYNYWPADFGYYDGWMGTQIEWELGTSDTVKISIVPAMNSFPFDYCDVDQGDNPEDCETINNPWELSWAVQDDDFTYASVSPRTYYGGVDSVLELRCDRSDYDYWDRGSYIDMNKFAELTTTNIVTSPSAKPRSIEYAGSKTVCQGINLGLVDKSGNGWFDHAKLQYSEYIVSSDNEIVVRGTMVKPAFHETVELKIPDGDYVLRVPSKDDWAGINNHGWSLSQGKTTSISGTAYDELQFTVLDCALTFGAKSNFRDTPTIGMDGDSWGIWNAGILNAETTNSKYGSRFVASNRPLTVAAGSSALSPSSTSSGLVPTALSLPRDSVLVVAGAVVGLVVGKFLLPKFKAAYEPVADVSAHNANVRA